MALNSLGLGIVISARDEASRVFARVNRAFVHLDGQSDQFVKKMRTNGLQMAAGLGAVSLGVVGLGGAFAAAKAAGNFEAVMTNLRVVSKASAEQMQEFRNAVIGANADGSKFAPVETAEALQDLAQRGFTAAQALTMLKPVTDLATASLGQLGLGQAAEVVTNAIHGFGLNASEAGDRVDQMTQASNMSGMAFRDLTYGIGKIARGAMAANQTFEESVIALGMMRNQMHSIELASNAGSVAMERLVEGTKGSKALQKHARVFDEVTGKIRPFRQIILDLIPAMDRMSVKAGKAFLIKGFGKRGLAGAQAMMTQLKTGIETNDGRILRGQDMINYQNELMAGAKGSADRISKELLKTLPGQMQLLSASWKRLVIAIGEPLAEALKPLTTGLFKVINIIKNVVLGMPMNVKKGLAQFFLIAGALTTVFGALLAGKALMVLFGVTFAGIAAAAASMIVPLLAIGGAIGGIILLMKAFRVHAEQTGGGVIGFFTDMARKVSLAFRGLMQIFQEGGFSGDIMLELNKAENSGVKAFAIKIFLWVERIKNFLRGMWSGFQEGVRQLRPTFDRLVEVLSFVASAFGLSVGPANDNISAWERAGKTGESLGHTLSRVAGAIANGLTAALFIGIGVVQIFKTMWASVGPVVTDVATTIWGAVQLVAGVLSGDWATAWRGAVNLVYGLLQGLVHTLASFLKLAAKVPGIIPGMGVVTGLAEELDLGVVKRIDKFLEEDKQRAFAEGPQPKPSTFVIPAPSAKTAPAVAATQAFVGPTLDMLKPQSSEAKQPTVIDLNLITKWDSETLAKLQKYIKTDADARGFTVGAHP